MSTVIQSGQTPMTHNLFAYGTLMLPEVLEVLTDKLLIPEPATLVGYSNYIFKGECYPGIVKDKNGTVAGVIYRDIDDYIFSILDWYEEVLYERHLLTVQSANQNIQAFTYVVLQQHQCKLGNTVWAFTKFKEKYADTYVKKCTTYRKQWEQEVGY